MSFRTFSITYQVTSPAKSFPLETVTDVATSPSKVLSNLMYFMPGDRTVRIHSVIEVHSGGVNEDITVDVRYAFEGHNRLLFAR